MNDFPFGYCTNVHAGPTLELAKENLIKFAVPVANRITPGGKLPVGLWLAEKAASEVADAPESFLSWLSENSLQPYTLNGFPQEDFHQDVVKHHVYKPTWLDERRVSYTLCLANVLSKMLQFDGKSLGSISTLPLGWPHEEWKDSHFVQAATNLKKVALELSRIHQASGVEIVLAIEPEPGCVLNTAPEIVNFFERYLFCGESSELAQRYLGVCHDICHSGVMFELQEMALQSYLKAGIRIGKVQVSSAVHVPWDECESEDQQRLMLKQLEGFSEPKYLHQVTRSAPAKDGFRLVELLEDLPVGLEQWTDSSLRKSPWRVHFHVPIFVDRFNLLSTTQSDISTATKCLKSNQFTQIAGADWFTGHYEVETYAWPVLPETLAVNDLADGIAKELRFFESLLQ